MDRRLGNVEQTHKGIPVSLKQNKIRANMNELRRCYAK